jgi:hypothetical protein
VLLSQLQVRVLMSIFESEIGLFEVRCNCVRYDIVVGSVPLLAVRSSTKGCSCWRNLATFF